MYARSQYMKVTIERIIEIDDVSMKGEVLPSALLRIFQDSAIVHSRQVGYSTKWFAENAQSWVLKKIAYGIHSPVRLHDNLTILTWTRGIEKIRGSREFKILRGDEHVISASSTWIFVDTKRRRPTRVPKEMLDAFETDPDFGIERPPDVDKAALAGGDVVRERLTINYGDFDINGHVNNTAYANYLQSAVYRSFGLLPEFIFFQIDFKKEIRSGVTDVDVVLTRSSDMFAFEIVAEDTVRADGVLRVAGSG